MLIELTEAEQAALLRLLDDYDQKLSRAGCNDFEMEATEGNKALILAAGRLAEVAEEDINLTPFRGKLTAHDQTILGYLRSLIDGTDQKRAEEAPDSPEVAVSSE